jgi:hypothetical protein
MGNQPNLGSQKDFRPTFKLRCSWTILCPSWLALMDARSLYNGCDSVEWPRRERDLGVDQRHRERVVDSVCAVGDRHLFEGGHEDGNAHQDAAGRVICVRVWWRAREPVEPV